MGASRFAPFCFAARGIFEPMDNGMVGLPAEALQVPRKGILGHSIEQSRQTPDTKTTPLRD